MTTEPTTVTIPRPHVTNGPKGVAASVADADYLRSAVRNIESQGRGERLWGSGVTEMVSKLLNDAADALTVEPERDGAVARVTEYVRQFSRLQDTAGVVHSVHTDPETEGADLLLRDMRDVLGLLAERDAQVQRVRDIADRLDAQDPECWLYDEGVPEKPVHDALRDALGGGVS